MLYLLRFHVIVPCDEGMDHNLARVKDQMLSSSSFAFSIPDFKENVKAWSRPSREKC